MGPGTGQFRFLDSSPLSGIPCGHAQTKGPSQRSGLKLVIGVEFAAVTASIAIERTDVCEDLHPLLPLPPLLRGRAPRALKPRDLCFYHPLPALPPPPFSPEVWLCDPEGRPREGAQTRKRCFKELSCPPEGEKGRKSQSQSQNQKEKYKTAEGGDTDRGKRQTPDDRTLGQPCGEAQATLPEDEKPRQKPVSTSTPTPVMRVRPSWRNQPLLNHQ
ncbi:uncharacterized protein LOC128777786 [Panthera pardus]|uniref:Uncharacterized protein LOC128777786 n=1 Tax=Panthera pardus TaxID=9691 RepID=A0A9W2VRU4_PANPR|nr:uncharacterized protein LOC128777786 [Panthera pardus]